MRKCEEKEEEAGVMRRVTEVRGWCERDREKGQREGFFFSFLPCWGCVCVVLSVGMKKMNCEVMKVRK